MASVWQNWLRLSGIRAKNDVRRHKPQLEILEDRTLPAVSFLPAVNYPVGVGPNPETNGVALGDFNHDGKVDMAVSTSNNNSVNILLGNGDGTFQVPSGIYAVGQIPYTVAVGDFNGDNNLDLVTPNLVSNSVSVLLGNGDGTFQLAIDSATGSFPCSVALADFDDDGITDLATADALGGMSVLFGNGDGSFQSPTPYGAGAQPNFVVAGHLNADDDPDLVVVNYGSSDLTIYLNNGAGAFTASNFGAASANPNAAALADLDGDGNTDLVVSNQGSANLSIALGNGNGTFQTPSNIGAGGAPSAVSAADFDGDNKLDLAVTNIEAHTISILTGNGDGTFQAPVPFATSQRPTMTALGDLNMDNKIDLAAPCTDNDVVSVRLNDSGIVVPPNSAPTIDNVSAVDCTDTELNFTVQASDVDLDDLTYTISGGAKTAGPGVALATGFSIDSAGVFHWTPGAGQLGQYTFTITVSDGEDEVTQDVTVTTLGVVDGVLTIVGTSGVDKIEVKPTAGDPEQISVKINEKDYHYKLKPRHNPDNPYTGVNFIHVFGLGGNDKISINNGIAVDTWLEGGAGDDTIKGGDGDDVILGGAGNDDLGGDSGHDVLLGGLGCDKVSGDKGNDILVAGALADMTHAALAALRDVWLSLNHTEGNTYASSNDDVADDTNADDLIGDSLKGNQGADWFILDGANDSTDANFGKVRGVTQPWYKEGDWVTIVS